MKGEDRKGEESGILFLVISSLSIKSFNWRPQMNN